MKQPIFPTQVHRLRSPRTGLVSGATPTNVGGAPDAWAIDPEISTSIQDFRSTLQRVNHLRYANRSTFSRYVHGLGEQFCR